MFFTSWHEIAHLLVACSAPPRGVHRSPSPRRDPLESLVDEVASRLTFFEPVFAPIVEREEDAASVITFEVVARIR